MLLNSLTSLLKDLLNWSEPLFTASLLYGTRLNVLDHRIGRVSRVRGGVHNDPDRPRLAHPEAYRVAPGPLSATRPK